MKCGYCKEKIALGHNGFSGIKEKFCQTCWSKIYNIHNALRRMENEPKILQFVLKIS